MGKKKADKNDSSTALETPEYEKLATVEEVEAEVDKHQKILVGRDFLERQLKANKKEYVSSTNEQLKEIAEEREHEMGVLGALNDRKKQLNKVIPIRGVS